MIKGLYFKLNLDNERDKRIYDFFTVVPQLFKIDKVEILFHLVNSWQREDYEEANNER